MLCFLGYEELETIKQLGRNRMRITMLERETEQEAWLIVEIILRVNLPK